MFDFESIGRPKDLPSHWNKFVELFSLRILPQTIAALNHSVDFKMLVPDASLRLLNLNDELEGLLSEPVLNSFVFTARYAWTVKIPIKVTRDLGRILAFTTRSTMSIRPTVPGLNLQSLQDLVNKKPFNLYKTTCSSHFDKPYTRHKNKVVKKIIGTICSIIVGDCNSCIYIVMTRSMTIKEHFLLEYSLLEHFLLEHFLLGHFLLEHFLLEQQETLKLARETHSICTTKLFLML